MGIVGGVAVAVAGCAKGQKASPARLLHPAPTGLLMPPAWELLGLLHPEVVPTGLLVHPSQLVQGLEVVLGVLRKPGGGSFGGTGVGGLHPGGRLYP